MQIVHLDIICATHDVGACVLVLHDLELKAFPVSMHLVQRLLQAVLFAGTHTDGLQGLQLGRYALVQQVLNREGIPDALLTLLDCILIILYKQNQIQSKCTQARSKLLFCLPLRGQQQGRQCNTAVCVATLTCRSTVGMHGHR